MGNNPSSDSSAGRGATPSGGAGAPAVSLASGAGGAEGGRRQALSLPALSFDRDSTSPKIALSEGNFVGTRNSDWHAFAWASGPVALPAYWEIQILGSEATRYGFVELGVAVMPPGTRPPGPATTDGLMNISALAVPNALILPDGLATDGTRLGVLALPSGAMTLVVNGVLDPSRATVAIPLTRGQVVWPVFNFYGRTRSIRLIRPSAVMATAATFAPYAAILDPPAGITLGSGPAVAGGGGAAGGGGGVGGVGVGTPFGAPIAPVPSGVGGGSSSTTSSSATPAAEGSLSTACHVPLLFDRGSAASQLTLDSPSSFRDYEGATHVTRRSTYHGVVFSNVPLPDPGYVELETVRNEDTWAGYLEVGLATTRTPSSSNGSVTNIPSLPNQGGLMHRMEMRGATPSGSRLRLERNRNVCRLLRDGVVVGGTFSIPVTALDRPIYPVVNLYGRTTEIRALNPRGATSGAPVASRAPGVRSGADSDEDDAFLRMFQHRTPSPTAAVPAAAPAVVGGMARPMTAEEEEAALAAAIAASLAESAPRGPAMGGGALPAVPASAPLRMPTAPPPPTAPMLPVGLPTAAPELRRELSDHGRHVLRRGLQGGGKARADDPDEVLCTICMENIKDTAFVPCGHMACCYACAKPFETKPAAECPVCRGTLTHMKVLRVYF